MGFFKKPQKPFWSYVEKRGPTDCWVWIGGHIPDGYGTYRFNGKVILAHRLAWIMTHGDIPAGMFVLHRCDNRPCVNPDHLFLGTQSDNVMDMTQKGRHGRTGAFGESHYKTKLSKADVLRIRDLAANGHSHKSIANQFGVARRTVSAIVERKNWKHV